MKGLGEEGESSRREPCCPVPWSLAPWGDRCIWGVAQPVGEEEGGGVLGWLLRGAG